MKKTRGFHLPVNLMQEFEETIRIKKETGDLGSSTSASAVIESLIREWVNSSK